MRIILPNNWEPRWYQADLWKYLYDGISCQKKNIRAVQVAHRRWGKDDISLHFSAVSAHLKIGNYWHMLPEYKQGRKAIWEAVNPKTNKRRIDEAFPKELRANIKDQEMFIRFKNGSTWQVVGSDNYNCYSSDTEVLTCEGWKFFNQLTDNDEVATLQDDVLVFERPSKRYEYDYSGPMYKVYNNAIDVLTTPNHKFYIESKKGVRKFKTISDPTILGDKIPATCSWKGIDQGSITIPAQDIKKNDSYSQDLQFDMHDFAAFLGIFLTEGCTFSDHRGNYRVFIAQSKPNNVIKINDLLEKMNLRFIYDGKSFIIHNKVLHDYCKRFGLCHEKFIPLNIKGLSSTYLKILFDWMIMGDGWINAQGSIGFSSTSKRLIDDFQEIAIKIGYSANIWCRTNNSSTINGRSVVAKRPIYICNIRKSKYKYFRDTKESYVSVEQYNGKVYCVEVSSHIIKVRRNGKELWCGNSYVGAPPVGVVMSEYALADPRAWAYISPILEENGGWAIFIYTARPVEHAKKMYDLAKTSDGWFASLQRAEDTEVFTADQLDRIRNEYVTLYGDLEGESLFEQEYRCSWQGAIAGAYYAKQMSLARAENRITSVPHYTGTEVHTFWDLGIDDSMSIWFLQVVGKEYHWIDYYENTGEAFEHYAKVLKDKRYVYGNHYMPHDIANRELSAVSAMGGAASRQEVAESLGIRPIIKVKRPTNIKIIIEAIGRIRNLFSQFWFDEVKCSKGLSALDFYHAVYDHEKKKLQDRPDHDWSSHAASAMQTFILGYAPPTKVNNFYLEDSYYGEFC